MTDSSIARITGMFGVACVLLSWAQFPLWVIGGAPPFYDSEALARHLYDIRTTAFIRILMDQGIYVSMMIFAAGFRHLVQRARPESDWLSTGGHTPGASAAGPVQSVSWEGATTASKSGR